MISTESHRARRFATTRASFALVACLLSTATASSQPPASSFQFTVVVREEGGALGTIKDAKLLVDGQQKATTNDSGFAESTLPRGSYDVRVEADGFKPTSFRIELTRHLNRDVRLARERDPEIRGRLRREGRGLVYPDGRRFDWKGLTAFRLLEMVAHGNDAQAVAFMRWGRGLGYNMVRVLAQLDGGMFVLKPEEGRAALPRLFEIAAREDMYIEIVAIAGSRGDGGGFPRQDRDALRGQVKAVGAACAAVSHCVLELANENSHPSQVQDLTDVPFLRELRGLVPGEVLVSLGSTHGGEDESDIFKDGDFLTVHLDRSRDPWNMVRRVRELEALSSSTGKFVVNDEPIKFTSQMSDCAIAFTFGALGRGMGVGTTYHFDSGLQAQPATGSAEACAKDLLAGIAAVPMGLRYSNAGFADSPVKSAAFDSCIVRAYSFVGGPEERTVPLGVKCDPRIEWQNGYRPDRVVDERPGVQVLRVVR